MLSYLRSFTTILPSIKSQARVSSTPCFATNTFRTLHFSSKPLLETKSASKEPSLITIVPCSARPDLLDSLDSPTHPTQTVWPHFLAVNTKEISQLFEDQSLLKWQFMAVANISEEDTGTKEKIVGLSNSIPFYWSTPTDNNSLPDLGWDAVIRSGLLLNQFMKAPRYKRPKLNALSALAVAIDPSYRFKNTGRDLAAELLNTMKIAAIRSGFSAFVLPVRPTGKASSPEFVTMDFGEYCAKIKGEGNGVVSRDILAFNDTNSGKEPLDPWVRKHVRMGGKVAKVALRSTTIKGSSKEWEEWTGINFATMSKHKGSTTEETAKMILDIMIPGGLVPVKYYPAQDVGIYEEPNLWMRYF